MKHLFSQRHFLELSIHIVSWLLIFGFPLVFMERGSGFNPAQFLRHSCVPLCYFIIFYVNYLWLVPRYMFMDEMRKYILSDAVLILCLSILLHVFLESISTPPPPEFARHIPPRWIFYVRDMGMMIFVAGLGAAIRTSLRWRQAEERLIETERQKTEAELKNVGSALDALPHCCGRFPKACPRTVLTRLHVHGSPLHHNLVIMYMRITVRTHCQRFSVHLRHNLFPFCVFR
nr:hypothetical protein [Phocaeicola sartorii]